MTTESGTAVPTEDIARITRLALVELSKTHVIIPKDEFRALMADQMDTTADDVWQLMLDSYRDSASQLRVVLSSEAMKGYLLGLNLLERLRQAYEEALQTADAPSDTEN